MGVRFGRGPSEEAGGPHVGVEAWAVVSSVVRRSEAGRCVRPLVSTWRYPILVHVTRVVVVVFFVDVYSRTK